MVTMTDGKQREFALSKAGRMRMLASELKQMGFKETARFLAKNADAAMKWAARPESLAQVRWLPGVASKQRGWVISRGPEMSTKIPEWNLEALLTAVQVCDDRIGRYSDHEGNEEGPTFYHWKQGREAFQRHCDRAIGDHQEAIKVFRRFKRLASRGPQ